MWECRCQCGKMTIVRTSDLTSQKVKSCGCYHSETSRENVKKSHSKYPRGYNNIGDIPSKYISQIKHRAFVKHREYSVSTQYLWDLFLKQNQKCSLTGLNIGFEKMGNTASLDRIDSSKGYVEGNVQWVHKDINNIKQDFSLKDLLNYCELIIKHENEKYSK